MGDVVRVKVLEVDEVRKRISLTLRLDDELGAAGKPDRKPRREGPDRSPRKGSDRAGDRGDDRRRDRDRRDAGRADRTGSSAAPANSAMAEALRRAGPTGK
jgi:uncharacterized protein